MRDFIGMYRSRQLTYFGLFPRPKNPARAAINLFTFYYIKQIDSVIVTSSVHL